MSNSRVGNSGGYKKKNRYKLKDGDVVFRILPPYAEINQKHPTLGLPNCNAWSRYYAVHFGYKNAEGKARPFLSPLVVEWKDKVKTIKVADPAEDRITDLKAKLAKAIEEKNDPAAARLNVLVGKMAMYNIDKNHHMNVVDLQGNIGTLAIRHKAKAQLDAEIKKLEAEGVDPLSLEDGRFFVFNRIGSGNETSFKVTVYAEKVEALVNGKPLMVDSPVSHKVDLSTLSRLKTESEDLDDMFEAPSVAEVAQIVNEAEILTGKSPACDRLFDARWKAEREAKKNAATPATDAKYENGPEGEDEPTQEATGGTGRTATPPATQTQAAASAPAAAVTAPAASAAAPAATSAPAVTTEAKPTQAKAIEEQSDDEFFASLGVQPVSA